MALKDKTQRFGTTEISDPSFHLDLFDNLYEGNLIITKRLTPKLIDKLIEHKEKIILHCTVTGFGGTKIEPFVPTKEVMYQHVLELIEKGFPVKQIVLRVDPIIPTEKGIQTALSVIKLFEDTGIKRIRVSFMDMYAHVQKRFKENDIPLPYETFHASEEMREKAIFEFLKLFPEYEIEFCGEPPTKLFPNLMNIPCLSQKDVDILGLTDKITLVGNKGARKDCGCAQNKTELIKDKPKPCKHGCLYCFWHNDEHV
jgi:hypothetical protein